jgi:hypothetical protein
MRVRWAQLICLVFLGAARAGFAQVVYDTYSTGVQQTTSGYLATAQTFTAPAAALTLNSYQFSLAPRTGGGTITFGVYVWGQSGPTGAALFSTPIAWPAAGGPITLSNIGVTLAPNVVYGVFIDLLGYSGQSVLYISGSTFSLGDGWWGSPGAISPFSGLDHQFHAEFVAVPEPAVWVILPVGLMLLRRYRRSEGTKLSQPGAVRRGC